MNIESAKKKIGIARNQQPQMTKKNKTIRVLVKQQEPPTPLVLSVKFFYFFLF